MDNKLDFYTKFFLF